MASISHEELFCALGIEDASPEQKAQFLEYLSNLSEEDRAQALTAAMQSPEAAKRLARARKQARREAEWTPEKERATYLLWTFFAGVVCFFVYCWGFDSPGSKLTMQTLESPIQIAGYMAPHTIAQALWCFFATSLVMVAFGANIWSQFGLKFAWDSSRTFAFCVCIYTGAFQLRSFLATFVGTLALLCFYLAVFALVFGVKVAVRRKS